MSDIKKQKREQDEMNATGQLVALNKNFQLRARLMLLGMGVPEEEIAKKLAQITAGEGELLLGGG